MLSLVIDAATKQPLQGAVVTVIWMKELIRRLIVFKPGYGRYHDMYLSVRWHDPKPMEDIELPLRAKQAVTVATSGCSPASRCIRTCPGNVFRSTSGSSTSTRSAWD